MSGDDEALIAMGSLFLPLSAEEDAERRSAYETAGTLTPEVLNAAFSELWHPVTGRRWVEFRCALCQEPVDISSGGGLVDAARDHYRLMHPDTEWPPLEPWLTP